MTSVWRWAAPGAILVLLVMTVSGVPEDWHKYTRTRYIPSQELQEHGIIVITQNADFADWPGNGTAENPYVIENLTISSDNYCVIINGTSAHFVIRNCSFEALATCVSLLEVDNGTIERCRFTEGVTGIAVGNSTLCRLENNEISGFSTGLLLSNVSNITVTGNSVHHCTSGVFMNDTFFSSFSTNDIFANLKDGLAVASNSANNTFLTNALGWNGRLSGLHYDAEDDGLQNRWDNGTHGNYWTDTVPGEPRRIPGRANSTDSVPALLTDFAAPTITEAPEDVAVDDGEPLNLTWFVSERFPDTCDIYVDDLEHQWFDWSGHGLTLDRNFTIGAHNITVVFEDCSNNSVVDTVIVQVIWGFFEGIGTEIVFASSVLSVVGVLLAVVILKRR